MSVEYLGSLCSVQYRAVQCKSHCCIGPWSLLVGQGFVMSVEYLREFVPAIYNITVKVPEGVPNPTFGGFFQRTHSTVRGEMSVQESLVQPLAIVLKEVIEAFVLLLWWVHRMETDTCEG